MEERGIGWVRAVACSAEVPTDTGPFRADPGEEAAGTGLAEALGIDLADAIPGRHQLLIRRNRTTGELTHYRCRSTTPTSLATLLNATRVRDMKITIYS